MPGSKQNLQKRNLSKTLLEEQLRDRRQLGVIYRTTCYLMATVLSHHHSWKMMDTIKLAVRLLCPHILEKDQVYFPLSKERGPQKNRRRGYTKNME